jgi:hypothetical protein
VLGRHAVRLDRAVDGALVMGDVGKRGGGEGGGAEGGEEQTGHEHTPVSGHWPVRPFPNRSRTALDVRSIASRGRLEAHLRHCGGELQR